MIAGWLQAVGMGHDGHDRISQRLKSRFPGYALEDCRLQRREF